MKKYIFASLLILTFIVILFLLILVIIYETDTNMINKIIISAILGIITGFNISYTITNIKEL